MKHDVLCLRREPHGKAQRTDTGIVLKKHSLFTNPDLRLTEMELQFWQINQTQQYIRKQIS